MFTAYNFMQTYSCCFTDSIIGEITLVKLQIIGYWKPLNKFGEKDDLWIANMSKP